MACRAGHERAILSKVSHNVAAAGVLDGLLEHEGDLTSVEALLKMLPPLESALQAYRDRAMTTNKSLEHVVLVQAAVQGW